MEAHGHPDSRVFGEDVQGRTINLDIEVDLFLLPEIGELSGQEFRRRPLVEGANSAPFGRLTLSYEVIEVNVREIEDDEDSLVLVAQLVPVLVTPYVVEPLLELI